MINPFQWLVVHKSPSEGRRRWQIEQRNKNFRRLFIVLAVFGVFAAAGILFAMQNLTPILAVPLEVAGKTITVRRGGNFQAALNQAKSGDTIILEAGAEFAGSFELANKPGGTEFITIQSSQTAQLPENVRVSPKDAAKMPKILSNVKGAPAVFTAPSAHHYRFIGVEFSAANDDYIYNLIGLGSDNQKATEVPAFLEFDRCYVHTRGLNKTRRGFMLNSSDTIIKNSHVAGFAGAQDEAQAIASWNGTGRYKILNNHLEGGAENILFGGNDPSIKNLVATDVEIRGNYFTKPESWRGKVTIKNTIELKSAKNVKIIGNILDNSWDCFAFVLTIRNQDGKAPWSTIEDVEIRNNHIRNAKGAINILGEDDTNPSQKMKRVKISNNLFEKLEGWDSHFLKLADGEEIEISHNTIFHEGSIMMLHRAPSRKFVFNYNIVSFNTYGVYGEGAGVARNFPTYFPDGRFVGNVIINGKSIPPNEFVFVPRNFLVPTYNGVGFADYRNGNYQLAADSKFKAKADNGSDIGCDFKALNTAVAGVETSASLF